MSRPQPVAPSDGPSPKNTISSSGSPVRQSPLRHHQRAISTNRIVKETSNARSEYSNNEEDGASQRRINQYLIKEEIGRGSFGAVHLAVDQYDEEYAVKEFSKSRLRKRAMSELLRRNRQNHANSAGLPKLPVMRRDVSKRSLADTQHSFDLIKEEIAVMKKLDHVNLVSLIEVLDDPEEDSLYMVLEYCKKGVIMKVDLDSTAEPYDPESCRHWFRDLILGIEYLHTQGVVHRDIKPDNLLLTEDDTLKIVDFGVSEMFDKNKEMKIAKSAGSPAFMAPELVGGAQGDVMGAPTDIWSMGVTLYCLRYGSVPFRQTNIVDLYQSISNDKIDFENEEDKNFKDLMSRLLEKDPSKRIAMDVLREHPWVTRDGEDPLMPKDENCPEIITAPTEKEKNEAITSNLTRTLVVLKAVSKFKYLIARKKPYLLDSFFGPGSQMARGAQEMNDNRKAAGRLLHSIFSSHSSTDLEETGKSDSPSRASSPTTSEGRGRHVSSIGHTQEAGRGHAQDPTETHLFFDIGSEPVDLADDTEEHVQKQEHVIIVSESPPSAGYNMFAAAYNGEVRRIRQRKGQDTIMYLTRRVEGSGEVSSPSASGHTDESAASAGRGKALLQGLVGKATEVKMKQAATSADKGTEDNQKEETNEET